MSENKWPPTRVVDQICSSRPTWEEAVNGWDDRTRDLVNEMADIILMTGIQVSFVSGFTRGAVIGLIIGSIITTLIAFSVIR